MRKTFIVVDGALPAIRAEELRAAMDGATYEPVVSENVRFQGVCKDPLPEGRQVIADALGFPVEWINIEKQFWKLSLAGEDHEFRVHSDKAHSRQVALLYFSRDAHATGGTSFWQHRSGIWAVPDGEVLLKAGINPQDFDVWVDNECFKPEEWTCKDTVCFRFNRLLVTPTAAFRSRAPFEGWGNCSKDGRLVWTCLFNVEPTT